MSLAAIAAAAQTTIQVKAPNVVTLNEQFNITFIVEGARPSDFSWSAGDDWVNIWGPAKGYSVQTQNINGKQSQQSQSTFTYTVRAAREGSIPVPQAAAVVNGQQIHSGDVKIEVLAGAASQPKTQSAAGQPVAEESAAQSPAPATFLIMEVSKDNVVIGQPVTAVIKLYTNENIYSFEDYRGPAFDGFKIQSADSPSRWSFQRELYDGKIYESTTICEYVVIPQSTGKVEIAPAELIYLEAVPVSDRLFGHMDLVRHKVATDPVTLNVKSLPSSRPDSFAGGVGTFTASAYLNNDNLKTHDYASLSVKVSGTGNLNMLTVPKVAFPDHMEVYEPTTTSNMASDGISGSFVYEYPFIPRTAGDYEIGPIDYTYYDTDRNKFVTITIPAIAVSVAQGTEPEAAATTWYSSSRSKVATQNMDIRHIDTKSADLEPKGDFFVGSTLFWVFSLLFCIAAFIIWFLFRKMAARNADVAGMKHRKATKMALKRLRKAGDLLKKDQSAAFYEELHNALLGYVSDKLNMPVAELSKERISEVLLGNGVSEAVVGELVEILDSCEFARYAPSAANQAMTSDYEKAVEVISSIDSNMKTRRGNIGKYTAIALLLCCCFNASAQEGPDAESLWTAANESYEQGDYAQAAADYEAISEMGLESPALYYNTANAYFQQGKLANAILYYERALKLDPSYSDAEYNLNYANSLISDKIDPVPEFFLKEWFRSISYMMDSDGWAITFLILLAVTLSLGLTFLLARSVVWKRVGFYAGIVTLVLMFSALAFSLWQKSDYEDSDKAIVMRALEVRSTPSNEASQKVLFELNPGTKVEVLEIRGSSMKISIADGRQGWVKTYDLEII